MPRLIDLQKRLPTRRSVWIRVSTDEVLVADVRSSITPRRFVDEKLRLALASEGLPDRDPHKHSAQDAGSAKSKAR